MEITNGEKRLDMILDQVRDNRTAIAALDSKLDHKLEDVHERINDETSACHKRINPLEAGLKTLVDGTVERFKATRTRINWLYFIVGGLVVGTMSAALVHFLGGPP